MRPPPVIRKKNPSRVLNITIGVVATLFVGVFYFFMFDGYNMIKPKHPEREFVKGVIEKVVDAKAIRVKGTILVANRHEVTAINIASGTKQKVYSTGGFIHSVAGPNRNGLAVLAIGGRATPTHQLVVLNLKDRSVKELPARSGDVLWDDAVGSRIVVPEAEDAVYFVPGTNSHQLYDPQEYRKSGKLTRLDLETGETRMVIEDVFCDEFAVSADGKTIWYGAPLERAEARKLMGAVAYTDGKGPVAATYKWSQGVAVPAYSGDSVRILSEGSQLLVFTYNQMGLIDLKSNAKVAAPWPNYITDIWHLNGGIMIGTAKQVRLEDVKYDDLGPSMGGPQAMDRVVAMNLKSKQVHVILPHIESYAQWSYGDFDTGW